MSNIFSIDSKFFQFMTKVGDCMILSTLWLLFSLPLFTIGSSTTALYYSVVKILRNDGSSTVKTFWGAFKSNFKQSMILFLLAFLLCVLWGYGMQMVFQRMDQQMHTAIYAVYFAGLALLAMWLHYALTYIARFADTLITVILNTLYICFGNLSRSLLLLTLFIAVLLAVMAFWPMSGLTLFVLPAVYLLVASFLLESTYAKYMPDDSGTDETEA